MQYLPATWMFAPYQMEKFYYGIRNEKDSIVHFIKALHATARLQRDDFDHRRREAGARDDDIGYSGNSYTKGNGGDHSGAVTSGPNGNEGARGPAEGWGWATHLSVRRTLGYKPQDKNAAKP